jgi:hypothetical protein
MRSASLSYLVTPPPEAPKTPAVAEMSVSAAAVVSEKGAGSVQVTFKINDESKKLRFSATGADIGAIKNTPDGVLALEAGGWTLAKSGTAAVTLSNLVPGNAVTFTLMDEKKNVAELKVPVK